MKRIAFIIASFVLNCVLHAQDKKVSLDSCIGYAFQHNKDLLTRLQHLSAEEKNVQLNRRELLPDVTVNTGADYYWKIPVQLFPAEIVGGQPGTFIPVKLGRPYIGTYGAEANWDALDMTKWKDIKLALLQKQLASGNAEAYKNELAKNVRLSYYHVVLAIQNKRANDSLYANYKIIDSLIRQRFEEGITDKITLNQSKQLLSRAYVQVQSDTIAVNTALLNLKLWMGYPFQLNLTIDEQSALPDTAMPVFDATATPEYNLEKIKIETAMQNWQKARIAWLPTLSIRSGYSKTGYGNDLDFISKGDWFPSGYAGMKLLFPLSGLYKLKPNAERQKKAWEESKLHLDKYLFEKEKEFLEAQYLLKKYKDELAAREQDRMLAKENEQLTLQKIQNGIVDMVQLKQVQDDLYQLQQEYQSSYLNYLSQYIHLLYLQSNN